MRKQADASRVTCISVMLVAFTLHFVLDANAMVARDAAVLEAVSQVWGIGWNSMDPCSTPWLRCDSVGNAVNLFLSSKGGFFPEEGADINLTWHRKMVFSVLESMGPPVDLQHLGLGTKFQLTGNIPVSLGNLTNLQELLLDGNSLTGHIPESLGNLKNLTRLLLNSNKLTGPIPESLGNLKNLTELMLSENNLEGNIPASLGGLQSLFMLLLDDNKLSGHIPESLGNLKNLAELKLSINNLEGNIPASLGGLENLYNLDLSFNKLTGSIPESLRNLTSLSFLILSDNKLTGRIPQNLVDLMGDLQMLSLNSNNLTGTIPASLGRLQSLMLMDLSSNKLTGSIPESLQNLTNLTDLYLRNNELEGNIPEGLGNLSISVLDLHSNELTGSIPEGLGKLPISNLALSNNKLTGTIPESLGNLANVFSLYLSNNKFSGSIPESLRNLTKLQYLDLSNNKLTGGIPEYLGDFTSLSWLLLQNNFFTSIAPAVVFYRPLKVDGAVDFSGNCIPNSVERRREAECQIHAAPSPAPTLITPTSPTPAPSPSPTPLAPAPSRQKPRTRSSIRQWTWLAVSTTAAFVILTAAATSFCLAKRSSRQDAAVPLGSTAISTMTTYTLAEIRSMTRNWNRENLLGSGGFGSVYKGVADGQFVAVIKLKMEGVDDDNKATKEFLNEVAILSKVRHRNLVALKGFCCNRRERILVMEFVDNGNLADHLFHHEKKGLPVLEWSTRCRIATTAAEALHYLHSLNDEKIIHRDMKAENILLDGSYNSLVCDFGLAKLTPQLGTGSMPTVATRNVGGTRGYMAPEWLIQGILSDKMDVYSYGIVLLELITGATRFKCFSLGEGPDALYSVHEAAWIVCSTRQDALSLLLDPAIAETVAPASAMSILRLALHCINEERRDRPTMERIVRMLKGMIEVPPLPAESPSWFQELDTSIDFTN